MTGLNPSVGVGEYVTLWVIVAVIAVALLGWALGAAVGGAVVFAILGVLGVIIGYAILSRLYRLLLHGSMSAGGDS